MPSALRGTRRPRPVALVVSRMFVAVLATGALPTCSNPAPSVSVDATLDHVTISTVPDAVTTPDTGVDAAPLTTSIRVALLSSPGFGVDVCVTEVATEMTQGPLLFNQHQLQTRPDAGPLDGGSDAREAGGAPDAGMTKGDASQTDAASDVAVDASADANEGGALESGTDAPVDGAHDAAVDAARDVGAGSGDAGSDGGTPFGGVLAEQVTNYLSVAGAGTFDVAIVAGGASTCGVCPLAHRRMTLDAGKLYTLVVGAPTPSPADAGGDARAHGDATIDASHALDGAPATDSGDAGHDATMTCPTSLPLTILPLVDEPTLTSSARARFFNATSFNPHAADGSAGAFRVAVVEQSAVVPLATNVPPGHVALANPAGPGVDSLGYWSGGLISTTSLVDLRIGAPVDASADAVVEGGVGAPSWTFVAADDFDLAASTDHTGFIAGGAGSPLTLLWCNDSTTIGAVYTSCEMFTGQ